MLATWKQTLLTKLKSLCLLMAENRLDKERDDLDAAALLAVIELNRQNNRQWESYKTYLEFEFVEHINSALLAMNKEDVNMAVFHLRRANHYFAGVIPLLYPEYNLPKPKDDGKVVVEGE